MSDANGSWERGPIRWYAPDDTTPSGPAGPGGPGAATATVPGPVRARGPEWEEPPGPGAGGGWPAPPPPPPPGAPPSYPFPGGTTPESPSRHTAGFVIALVIALIVGFVGVRALRSNTGSLPNSIDNLLGPSSSLPSAQSPFSGNGSTGSNGSNGASPGNADVDASAIADKVDPAIVDINTVLGFQNGQAAGTGMVITSSGDVLTNNHVVDGATSITVQINGQGPTYTAHILGTDPTEDVALIHIDGVSNLKTISTADSSKVLVGDSVVAIGNALGRGGTPSVTTGTVTALDVSATASDPGAGSSEDLSGLIQTNARLLPGDSGGALTNANGQVIGMNTAASGRNRFGGTLDNVALAIPINQALSIAHQIQSGQASGNVEIGQRGYLGVQISAQSTGGAIVANVVSGSPAEGAGIATGDTITSIDGKNVDSPSTLTTLLGGHHPGDSVKVGWTDSTGHTHSATLKLTTGPAD